MCYVLVGKLRERKGGREGGRERGGEGERERGRGREVYQCYHSNVLSQCHHVCLYSNNNKLLLL